MASSTSSLSLSLSLYSHPLASFCHKVLIALYEKNIAFDNRLVDLQDDKESKAYLAMWPIGKIPLLRDNSKDRTIPETSLIIEYLDRYSESRVQLIPSDFDAALKVRLWDRFFDNYVQTPMQKVVVDRLREEKSRDAFGVQEAKDNLVKAYEMLEQHFKTEQSDWVCGKSFSLADCAAAPALFYAEVAEPFSKSYPLTTAYFERLLKKESVARTFEEAKPFLKYYPLVEDMDPRFK
jgi:glutathione S-transferase